jgi:hypothetical protein
VEGSDRTFESRSQKKSLFTVEGENLDLLHKTFLDACDLGVSGRFPGLEARKPRRPVAVGSLLDAEWIAQNRHSEIGLLIPQWHITQLITSVCSRTNPLVGRACLRVYT